MFALIVIQIAQKSALGPVQPGRETGLTVETVASLEAHPLGRAAMQHERNRDTAGASSLARGRRNEDRTSPLSVDELLVSGADQAYDSKKSELVFS